MPLVVWFVAGRNLTPIVSLYRKWHDNDQKLGHRMRYYDSLATQSSSKSHQEVYGMSDSKSRQEVYGMSEGSFNDHNDQSDLARTHCVVLVLAKKKVSSYA